MPDRKVIEEFIESNYRLNAAKRLQLRVAIRKIIRQKLLEYESFVFNEAPFDPDVVGNILSIEFQEASLEEDISAELKPHPDKTFKYLAIINSDIDNEQHKRFSKFHEISHVMHNLFDEEHKAFRTPKINQNSAFFSKNPREIVCDITASEMLFYHNVFKNELNTIDIKNQLGEQILNLCSRYNASIEATSRTLVENYPDRAFLIVIKEGYRKEEEIMITTGSISTKLVSKPRVAYAVINNKIKYYIPRNKSFDPDTIVHKSFYNNSIENEIIDLSDYGWGEGTYNACAIPEDDRCFFVGVKY